MAKIVITTKTNADAVWWMALANKLGEKVYVDFDFGGLSPSDCPEIVPKEKATTRPDRPAPEPPRGG